MASPKPYNPLVLISDQNTGEPFRWFAVTRNNTTDNVDGGNVYGTHVYNNTTGDGTISVVDIAGNTIQLQVPRRSARPILHRRVRSTGSSIATVLSGVPYLNRRPPYLPEVSTVDPITVAAGGTDATVDMDNVFKSVWTLTFSATSAATATATVAVNSTTHVVTITGVAAGQTVITLQADWFGGPDRLEILVTVT